MKSFYIFLITLIFISPAFLFSQDNTDTTNIIKFSERIPAELELEVKVKDVGAIGYAYCYRGQVLKVVRGLMPDTSILITVVAGDTTNLKTFKNAGKNEVLKLFLMFNKSNEEYSTTWITGFVDSQKNSWKIIYINRKDE